MQHGKKTLCTVALVNTDDKVKGLELTTSELDNGAEITVERYDLDGDGDGDAVANDVNIVFDLHNILAAAEEPLRDKQLHIRLLEAALEIKNADDRLELLRTRLGDETADSILFSGQGSGGNETLQNELKLTETGGQRMRRGHGDAAVEEEPIEEPQHAQHVEKARKAEEARTREEARTTQEA